MGRAKLNMELIADKKSRNTTFNNRKDGLIKKTHELATLCDVSACIIIYGPKQETGSFNPPEIWPPNADQVRGIITDVYKPSKNKDSSGSRTFGLPDFFSGRKRKIEGDLAKLKKKNMEAVYPTRPGVIDFMAEPRLREFAASLSNKSDYVKARIEFLRLKKQGLGLAAAAANPNHHGLMTQSQTHRVGLGLRGIEPQAIQLYPTMDHQRNSSSMMMRWMMNGGGGPSVDHLQPRQQASYEVMGHGPRHYGPDLPVRVPYMPVGPYMQMMTPPLPPPPLPPRVQELHLWTRAENNVGQEDVVRNDYQMNYKRARYFY